MSLSPLPDPNILDGTSEESVRSELEAILSSEAFGRTERPARFLRHLVETALRGESRRLKESVLGVEVFGREPSWDPRLDPVVRQEAARLRKRIARCYQTDRPDATLRIELPVGTYVPVFRNREAEAPPASPGPSAMKPVGRMRIVMGAVLVICLAVAAWRLRAPRVDNTRSIVVLPFVNLSSAATDQYLADGLTDEITLELAQLKSLKVVSRSSAFQFRGKTVDIREVGRQLNVAYALEGSVERLGNGVNISAHLERVSDGTRVWSKTYRSQAAELFAVQRELAEAIATRLQSAVAGQTRRKHVAGEEAHDLYMQGRYELEQMTPLSVARAEEALQRAIGRDPEYAAAYYALGLAKWNRTLASASQEVDQARKESEVLFLKALELDPELADAHAGLANYAMQFDWDWSRAERELRAGMADDPSVAIENSYAFLLVFENRFAEADDHIRKSQELDPIGSVSVSNRALLWNLEGRFSRSRDEYLRMLERSPQLIPPRCMVGLTYIEEGRPAMALPIVRELKQRTPVARMVEAMAAAREGRKSEALRLMRPFEEKYPEPGVASQWFALVYAFLGDEGNTVKWLGRSMDQHEWQALNLAVHPAYAPMRNSAAFRALKKRIGLEQGYLALPAFSSTFRAR